MNAAAPVVTGIWAHYDDDLLFGTPSIDRAIRSGHTVRNLFMTASDAGSGMSPYVAGRETGIRAAYDVMRGSTTAWSDRVRVLSNGVTLTETSPVDDPRVALSFLRLADGGLTGGGWFANGYRTIPKLLRGEIASLTTLDTARELTAAQLVTTVAAFISDAGATTVLANLPEGAPDSEGDHPDHGSVGRLVSTAVDAGLVDGSIVRYAIGYPGQTRPANLDRAAVARKLEIFAAYGEHDPVLRRDPDLYLTLPGVGEWLRGEHHVDHHALVRATSRR